MRFNCELRKEKYLANVIGKLKDKVTNLVIEVHVPIMCNSVDLRPQETLLLEVGRKIATVSYTHLTLPTKRIV